MSVENTEKVKVYARYPISSVLIYNVTTILHYLLGGLGIILGYNFLGIGYPAGLVYIAFAFVQMYVIMPLVVCPNCVYFRMDKGLCVTGLNVFSRKITKQGNLEDFPKRAKGMLSHNKLYMAAKIFPILAIIPALILNFSFILLVVFLAVLGLMVFRVFVLFPKIACIRCAAKKECPNAQSMGLNDT
jgi:hypothetical protein